MTSTPTNAIRCHWLRSGGSWPFRLAAKWACAAALLMAQAVAQADEGSEASRIKFFSVRPPAEAPDAGAVPAPPKPEGEPSGQVPAGEEAAKATEGGDFKVVPAEPPALESETRGAPTGPKPERTRSVLVPAGNEPEEKPQASEVPALPDLPYDMQPIGRLGANTSTPSELLERGEHPDKNFDYAARLFADRATIDARGMIGWQPLSYSSYGPGAVICSPPAYFAQTRVERYGLKYPLQPILSAAQFYGTATALPALWMLRPPWKHTCRGPECQPAGIDATAEFFQPTVVCRETLVDALSETP